MALPGRLWNTCANGGKGKENLLLKTKQCKPHTSGWCSQGKACSFAHGEAELRNVPDFTKTKLCWSFHAGVQCTKPERGHAHSRKELRRIDPSVRDGGRQVLAHAAKASSEIPQLQMQSVQGTLPARAPLPVGRVIRAKVSDSSSTESCTASTIARLSSSTDPQLDLSKVSQKEVRTTDSEKVQGAAGAEELLDMLRRVHVAEAEASQLRQDKLLLAEAMLKGQEAMQLLKASAAAQVQQLESEVLQLRADLQQAKAAAVLFEQSKASSDQMQRQEQAPVPAPAPAAASRPEVSFNLLASVATWLAPCPFLIHGAPATPAIFIATSKQAEAKEATVAPDKPSTTEPEASAKAPEVPFALKPSVASWLAPRPFQAVTDATVAELPEDPVLKKQEEDPWKDLPGHCFELEDEDEGSMSSCKKVKPKGKTNVASAAAVSKAWSKGYDARRRAGSGDSYSWDRESLYRGSWDASADASASSWGSKNGWSGSWDGSKSGWAGEDGCWDSEKARDQGSEGSGPWPGSGSSAHRGGSSGNESSELADLTRLILELEKEAQVTRGAAAAVEEKLALKAREEEDLQKRINELQRLMTSQESPVQCRSQGVPQSEPAPAWDPRSGTLLCAKCGGRFGKSDFTNAQWRLGYHSPAACKRCWNEG